MDKFPIFIVLTLVLAGMLFGFNIQVSSSLLSVINSLGTVIGGIGAATAAYISYRSINQWKEQSKHAESIQKLYQLESILIEILTNFETNFISNNGLKLKKTEQLAQISNLLGSKSKEYTRVYGELLTLLNKSQIEHLKIVDKTNLIMELSTCYFDYIKYYNESKKNLVDGDERALNQIPGVREPLLKYLMQINISNDLRTKYLDALRNIKVSLYS